MNARISRSAEAGSGSIDNHDERSGPDTDLAFDDLLDARFDDEGRLAEVGRGSRKRIAERLDPRPPATSAEELERAVQKLAEGLDAIERQNRSAKKPPARRAHAEPDAATGGGRDFVTYSLDRLEARLEALSKRLQDRAAAADADTDADRETQVESAPARHVDPSLAVGPDYAAESAELRRLAEAEAERVKREAEARRRAEQEAEAVKRLAELEAAEAKRRAEEEAAEARRRAEEAEAEARRRAEAAEEERLARLAEARREAEAEARLQRQFAEIEDRLEALQASVDENRIEPVREELMELLREIEDITHNRNGVAAALEEINARLGEMEVKVNAARNMAGNRLGDIQDRLAGLNDRLDQVEVEVPGFDAIRENQSAILERFDRMEGLVHHLASPEDLLDRVDGLRRTLETVATEQEVAQIEERILGLAERLDALPESLSDEEALERIEAQLAKLAAELTDARDQRQSASSDLTQHLSELTALLHQVGESGRTPDLSGLEGQLAAFGAHLEEDRHRNAEALAKLERRLAALATAVEEQEDEAAAEILAGLTRKVDLLAEAIDAQDTSGARREVEALGAKLDLLAGQIAEQTDYLSRAQVQPLEARLEEMQEQLDELTKRAKASGDQLRPFAQQLHDISERISTLGGGDAPTPLSLRLEAIEERMAALGNGHGKSADSRALQTQLEGIISRLELLKGRSIDPARLNELFDRVDGAIRALPDDRFDRLERKIADAAVSGERFDRLEKSLAKNRTAQIEEQLERLERRLADNANAGISDRDIDRLARKVAETTRKALDEHDPSDVVEERFDRLERKIESIGLASSPAGGDAPIEGLSELHEDILALRRELRSLPAAGQGETDIAEVLHGISARLDDLPGRLPATTAALEAQMDRIVGLLDDPSHSRLALAHIETSLKTIEERLDETRRALAERPADEDADDGEADAVAGLARALSDDVAALKGHADASEVKNKEALDAVQGTLEAVMKRMAFLEREADKAALHGEEEDKAVAIEVKPEPRVEPEKAGRRIEKPVFETAEAEPETGSDEAEAIVERLESPKPAAPEVVEVEAAADEPVAEAAEVSETPADESESEPAPEPEPTPRSGGLLSRFTSRQLLRRATGGRAESFTPQPEENEDEADFPLEPGTDSPLNSALTGAPSSNTEHLSGDRGKSRAEPHFGVEEDLDSLEAETVDEDFLTAARRAARAAAAEAAGPDATATQASGIRRLASAAKSRRGALVAAALAVAVAFAAVEVIRSQMSPGGKEIATAPEASMPMQPAEGAGEAAIPETSESEPLAAGETPLPAGEEMSGAAVPPSEPASEAMPAPTSGSMTALGSASSETPAPAPEMTPPEPPVALGSQRLRDAAEAGDPAAAFEVAARFAEGSSGLFNMPAAVAWYERAAKAGLAPAQYRLGSIYEKGLGVPKNLARAQDYYRRAADAGNVKAMHNLAVLFAEGAGGEPDLEKAAVLFRQAAEHGVRDSQFNLAILHARGLGVPQDLIEAYKWFSIAATSGDEESAKRRDIIAAALPEGDLAKARAAAAAFTPLPLVSEANEVLMPDGGWSDKLDSSQADEPPAAEGDESDLGSTLSENDLVALVQKLLSDQGFNPGPTDGLLGEQTIEAIRDFQQEAGLPLTGQIDTGLVKALKGRSG